MSKFYQIVTVLIFYFLIYFVVLRFFAFVNFRQPHAIVITLIAFIITLAVILIFKYFDKDLSLLTKKGSMKIMLPSAVLAILIGSRLATFGINWAVGSGFARIFNYLSGISVAFVFFTIVFYCIYNSKSKIFETFKIFADWRLWIVIIVYNVLAVLFVFAGRQVFFWDNAGFWVSSAELSEIIFSQPGEFVGRVIYSIFNSDYNYIPAITPALIMRIFGTSRLVFILSIVNLYYIPVVVSLFYICQKMHKPFISFIVSLVALPMIPYITILGFLDVGGVFLIMVILFVFLKTNRAEYGFLAGLLICLLTIFRRWYIVFTLAFFLCGFVYSLFNGKIKKYFAMVLGFVIPFFIFFQGYLTERLIGRYFADMYYAYRFPIGTDVRLFFRHFGFILVIAIIIYFVYMLWKYKKMDKNLAFLLALIITMFFILTRIQTHGQQHLLLYAAPFSLIVLLIYNKVADEGFVAKLVVYGIVFFCTISVFIPRTQPRYLAELTTYAPFPSFAVYPIIREDAHELLKLDEFLRGLDGRTAIMASSFTINPDLIARAAASLNPTRPLASADFILFLPDVDRRDGRPYNIVYADYILVAYPIQTHLAALEQQVVVIPAMQLLEGMEFSRAFEKMDYVFYLRDGVEVYIFRRLRANTEDEFNSLMEAIIIGGLE